LSGEEESKIIQNVLGGDTGAFEALVTDNQQNVYNLALKMTNNPDDALDISQEAFLRAYTRLGAFRGESRFSVWMYRMTYNLCIDFLRKSKRTAASPLTFTDDEGRERDLDVPDLRNLPEDAAIQSETRRLLEESIEKLSADHKEIFLMREVTGMNYADIAFALDISEGTVKSRLARARKALADMLGGELRS